MALVHGERQLGTILQESAQDATPKCIDLLQDDRI
jgi:hypothetical protein